MSRTRFIELANAFCALANIDQPASMVAGGPIQVDGIDFFLQYDEEFAPDDLVVYCNLGEAPPGGRLKLYETLLQTNMIVYGANSPCFMLSPDKEVVLGYQCRLRELHAPELLDIFLHMAEQARHWRRDYFLQA